MSEPSFPRRAFVGAALGAAALPLVDSRAADGAPAGRSLRVVCIGGHPDDPESGCAGTLARYSAEGHKPAVIYLTRGERGIRGKSDAEAAAVRTAECEAACKVIGARAIFAGQIDGSTEVTRVRVDQLRALLEAEKADVLFAHWPIDTHFDHQAASMLALCAWRSLDRRPALYFFEVNTGSQTQGFSPDTYVDISKFVEAKKAALLAHASQDGEGIWLRHHGPVAEFRGREAGVAAAEAFVQLCRDAPALALPVV